MSGSQILDKHSSTERWGNTWYIFDRLTGGQNLFLKVMFSYFSKVFMAPSKLLGPARRWHLRISEWMETNGYPAVNSEKTIFMKQDGDDFIIHGLFVDDMMHVPTCDRIWKEFLDKYY